MIIPEVPMRYSTISNNLFTKNRQELLNRLPDNAFAIINSSEIPWRCADGSSRFVQNSDLFYLTGIAQEDTILTLCPGHPEPKKRQVIFTREGNELIKIWEGHKFEKKEVSEISGIGSVEWNSQFDEHLRDLAARFDQVFLNYNEHARSGSPIGISPDDRFRQKVQSLYPNHRYHRLAPHLHRIRQAKSEEEIELLQKACDITESGFRRVLKFVKPGINEYEIEAEYLHEFVSQGSHGFAYEPIIASGVNACILHYLENDQPCKDGDLLLMDVAAEYAYYNADLTRTIPVNGKFTDRQRAVYDAVHRVLQLCIDELIVPGKSIRDTFAPEAARAVEEELIKLNLIDRKTVEEERAADPKIKEEDRCYRKYFMHGVSHSLGIDVHDVTPPSPEFVEGMVVTVEPGIYIEEEGFGVRLENDIIVRASGNIDLMANIPIHADEIEALMAEN